MQRELDGISFTKVFDNVFKDYTLQKTQGVYTMQDTGKTIKELSFIVTTFVDNCEEVQLRKLIQKNCDILKLTLNQESILVEVSKPEVMFL